VPYENVVDNVPVAGANGEIVVFTANVIDAAGNSRIIQTTPVTLSLTAALAGTIVVDAVPSLAPDHAGVDVKVVDAGGDTIAETLTDAAGAFSFAAIPEGTGDHLVATKSGWSTADVLLPTVNANITVSLPPV